MSSIQDFFIKKYGYNEGIKVYKEKFLKSVDTYKKHTRTLKEQRPKTIFIQHNKDV